VTEAASSLSLNEIVTRPSTGDSLTGCQENRKVTRMSIQLLTLFAVAMFAAMIGKLAVGTTSVANLICVVVLMLFVVLTRIQGVRKPVV
jgi:hypothetical protein